MNAIILLVILIGLNAMFAATEIAVISMNDVKLRKMADDGDKRAKRLVSLTVQPAKFLATIQVAITLANLLQSAVAAESFADVIVAKFIAMGVTISPMILKVVSVVVITLILAYFTLVFGELVPKRVAMKKSEGIALGMSGILYWVAKIFAPIVWLLTVSTNCILKLLRINPEEEESEVTEESIRMMLAEGKEKGTIQPEEDELIQNIFEFDDITAEELCTHRRDVEWLDLADDSQEWEKTIRETRYHKYPVCEDSQDDVRGILDVMDYYKDPDADRDSMIKKALLVPDTMKANTIFNNMRERREYFAVVIDEYGGMTGIATLRDIMETLLGELSEEEGVQRPKDIENVEEGKWIIQGYADLEDVEEEIKTDMPIDVYDTFSGFVCGILGRIPEEGESFVCRWKDYSITVHDVKNHMVQGATMEQDKQPVEE